MLLRYGLTAGVPSSMYWLTLHCPTLYLLSVLDGAAREVDVILQDSLPRAPRHELLTGRWDPLPERAMVHIIRVSERTEGQNIHLRQQQPRIARGGSLLVRCLLASMRPCRPVGFVTVISSQIAPPPPNSPKQAQNRLDSPGAVCFFFVKMSPLNYPTGSPGANFFYA